MNILPTLEGGLRIDAECDVDWALLRSIITDARLGERDLASRLGLEMEQDPHAEDWQEYVIPDLREGFEDQLDTVSRWIAEAMETAGAEQIGSVWIHRKDGMLWYGALNQARLALEEKYRFGPGIEVAAVELDPLNRTAFMRSQFYQVVQSLLLDYVIN